MRIRMEYRKYEHSPAATRWSRLAGSCYAGSIVYLFLFGSVLDKIQEFFLGEAVLAVSIIGSFIIFFAITSFCKRKERECAVFDAMKIKIGRELTDEEKKSIRKQLKQKMNT